MALLRSPSKRIFVTLGLVLSLAPMVRAQADEFQVKAAFLYNFAKFVAWPAQSFKSPSDAISVCVAGDARIVFALEQTVSGKTAEGRKIVVHMLSGNNGSPCHILFIASSDRKRAQAFLATVKSTGVLTVGESENFAADGGIINLKLEGDHFRIEINSAAAEQAGLKISSKLLSLAKVVRK